MTVGAVRLLRAAPTSKKGGDEPVSYEAVHWALHMAPMLKTERGKNDTTSRQVLVALCEVARGKQVKAFPSLATLRYMTGLDREVIRRALRRNADAGLIEDVGRRGDGVTCWLIHTELERPDTDLKAIEAEVAERRERDRERKKKTALSTVLSRELDEDSTVLSSGSSESSELRTAESTVLSRESTVLRLDSTTQHRPEPVRTGNEPVNDPVPPEAGDASAAAVEQLLILDAEIVEDEPKSKRSRKPRAKKPVDPVKQLRDEQAHDLATRYYEAKKKMTKFMAVRSIIRRALDVFDYDEVFVGVKHMAMVDRDRPFTLDTLRSAIERASGVLPPQQGRNGDPLSHLPPGDQIQVRTEFMKSRPNWERLASYGITPDNAAAHGFAPRAS